MPNENKADDLSENVPLKKKPIFFCIGMINVASYVTKKSFFSSKISSYLLGSKSINEEHKVKVNWPPSLKPSKANSVPY